MKTLTKSILVIFFFLWTMVCGLSNLSFADIPHLINYQGKLADNTGKPVTDGAYSVTFRIYDTESAGTLLWEETQSVSISRGIFSVLLGGVTNLSLAFDKPYWLEIKVGSEVMSPRQRMASVGHAYRASDVDIMPRGCVILWSGAIADIPKGWALCDGSNGTPDLRNKFIVGAGSSYSVAATGGSTTHTHTGTTLADATGDYRAWGAPNAAGPWQSEASRGYHTHKFTTDSNSSLPPYYSLAYIMKI